jgi:glucose/arabinose dehydrogenase
LYAAFDAVGNGGRSPALASYSGKVLRLNADGTTPQDQPAGLPVVAAELQSPRGIDWQPSSNALWVADAKRPDIEELRVVNAANGAGRRISLPPGTGASALAFYRGTLLPGLSGDVLVAAAEGHHLLRLRLDKRDPTRVVSTERLLQDAGSPIRAVATASDGTIYAATDRSVVRVGPK